MTVNYAKLDRIIAEALEPERAVGLGISRGIPLSKYRMWQYWGNGKWTPMAIHTDPCAALDALERWRTTPAAPAEERAYRVEASTNFLIVLDIEDDDEIEDREPFWGKASTFSKAAGAALVQWAKEARDAIHAK